MLHHTAKVLLLFLTLGLTLFTTSCDDDEIEGVPGDDGTIRVYNLSTDQMFGARNLGNGDTVVVLGRHLDDVTAITVLDPRGNLDIPFRRQPNDFQLTFNVPTLTNDQFESFDDKTILFESPQNSVEFTIDFRQPDPPGPVIDTLLITDFDGGGFPEAQGDMWGCYGSINADETGVRTGGDAIDGAYYQLDWDGNNEPPFRGCQTNNSFGPTDAVNAEETSEIFVRVSVRGTVGGRMEIILREDGPDPGNLQPFTYAHNIESAEWTEIEVPLSDFGFGFDPNNTDERDPDGTKITRIQFGISGASGLSDTRINVDNVRLAWIVPQ